MPNAPDSNEAFRQQAKREGYSDEEINEYLAKGTQPKTVAAPTKGTPQSAGQPSTNQQSWPEFLGREAQIVGGNIVGGVEALPNWLIQKTQPIRDVVRPALGLPPESAPGPIEGILPSPESYMHLGPTPQGSAERTLAEGSRLAGEAMGPSAWGLLGPKMARSMVVGGTLAEGRREFAPNMPLGPVVDVGLGALAGGTLGPNRSAGTAFLSPGVRTAVGHVIGEGAEWIARHLLGMSPGAAQSFGIPLGWLGTRIGAGLPGLSTSGAIAGGTTAAVTGPVPTTQNMLLPQEQQQ